MKKILTLVIFSLATFTSVLLVSPTTSALFEGAKDQACKGAALNTNANCGVTTKGSEAVTAVIKNIINLLTIIVGVAAVIVIIVNGLRFIVAGGDSNAIGSARTGIIYALIGLIVVALAQIIVRFVIKETGTV